MMALPRQRTKSRSSVKPSREDFEKTIVELTREMVELKRMLEHLNSENKRNSMLLLDSVENPIQVLQLLNDRLTQKKAQSKLIVDKKVRIEDEVKRVDEQNCLTLKEFQKNYNSTEAMLIHEVQLLRARVTSLQDVFDFREKLLKHYTVLIDKTLMNDNIFLEFCNDALKKTVVTKNIMQKLMESKLKRFAGDFQELADFRESAIVQRLLHLNSRLQAAYRSVSDERIGNVQRPPSIVAKLQKRKEYHVTLEEMIEHLQRKILKADEILVILEQRSRLYDAAFVENHKYYRISKWLTSGQEDSEMHHECNSIADNLAAKRKDLVDKCTALEKTRDKLFAKFEYLREAVSTAVQALIALENYEEPEGHSKSAALHEFCVQRRKLVEELIKLLMESDQNYESIYYAVPFVWYSHGNVGLVPRDQGINAVGRPLTSNQREYYKVANMDDGSEQPARSYSSVYRLALNQAFDDAFNRTSSDTSWNLICSAVANWW